MMAQEIVTAVSENIKLVIVIVQNHGHASIGELSEKLGSQRFGTSYRYRNEETGLLDGDKLPIDLAANAESLGAEVIRTRTIFEFRTALEQAKASPARRRYTSRPTPSRPSPRRTAGGTCRSPRLPSSTAPQQARKNYEANKANQRPYITPSN